jgi:hypothetical protein
MSKRSNSRSLPLIFLERWVAVPHVHGLTSGINRAFKAIRWVATITEGGVGGYKDNKVYKGLRMPQCLSA